jgi:hypothetical protein
MDPITYPITDPITDPIIYPIMDLIVDPGNFDINEKKIGYKRKRNISLG